jgi:hypothetical protein
MPGISVLKLSYPLHVLQHVRVVISSLFCLQCFSRLEVGGGGGGGMVLLPFDQFFDAGLYVVHTLFTPLYRIPMLHRKKSFSIFPSPAGMSLTKLSLGENNLYMTSFFAPRESLVSDIPAGDGNIGKLFYSVEHTEEEDSYLILAQCTS